MEKGFDKLFKYLKTNNAPSGLEKRILTKIREMTRKQQMVRIFVLGGSAIASFGLSVWAAISLAKNTAQTGFWQYLSLAFSENGTILSYWKEFAFSLVESLPILSLILFLTTIGFFIWSFTNIFKNQGAFNINMSFN